MGVSGHRHAPAALPLGKDLPYPLYRRLGGPQSRSGHIFANIEVLYYSFQTGPGSRTDSYPLEAPTQICLAPRLRVVLFNHSDIITFFQFAIKWGRQKNVSCCETDRNLHVLFVVIAFLAKGTWPRNSDRKVCLGLNWIWPTVGHTIVISVFRRACTICKLLRHSSHAVVALCAISLVS
jgi:hypothetical protein